MLFVAVAVFGDVFAFCYCFLAVSLLFVAVVFGVFAFVAVVLVVSLLFVAEVVLGFLSIGYPLLALLSLLFCC